MLKYWIWLAGRKGLGSGGPWKVARHFVSPEAAYCADRQAYEAIPELRSVESLLDKDLKEAEEILNRCFELGISLLTIQDAAYPERLRVIDDPPLVLYYKGNAMRLNGPAIGVVGTRRASGYGLLQSRRMSYGLAKCGCTVVTGGARGVDTEALKGALTGGGPVVAVLGCGLDVVYPPQNKRLFDDVRHYGCLVSEFPPGTQPFAGNFPVRNRIISGLSLGILVVEAPLKSGALITASLALDQGRDVFTLPANVGNESSAGNLKLLREGAIAAGEAWDIVQEYAAAYPDQLREAASGDKRTGELPPEEQPQPAEIRSETQKDIDKPKAKDYIDLKERMDSLSQDEQILAQLLQDGPQHIDELVARSQMHAGRALASLTLLEVKGIVRRPSARMYELAEK